MRSKKHAMNRSGVLLLSFLFLLSACSDPPDVPACTGFPALEWPVMRETFFKLCGDDPACNPRLIEWKKRIATWSDPSDAGWCKHIISGKSFDIDAENPAPWKGKDGNPMPWKDVYAGGVSFPAKQAWAPIKTWIQTNCRKTGKCPDGIGDWESTVNEIDAKVAR